MESGTFMDPDVAEIINNKFVAGRLFFYDSEGDPDEVANNFALFKEYFGSSDKAAPQYLIADKTGKEIIKFGGLPSPKKLTTYLNKALDTLK